MPQQYRNFALDVVRASATAVLTVQIRDGICNYTGRALTGSTARRNNEILLEACREHMSPAEARRTGAGGTRVPRHATGAPLLLLRVRVYFLTSYILMAGSYLGSSNVSGVKILLK